MNKQLRNASDITDFSEVEEGEKLLGDCCCCGSYAVAVQPVYRTQHNAPKLHLHCDLCYYTDASSFCGYQRTLTNTDLMRVLIQVANRAVTEIKREQREPSKPGNTRTGIEDGSGKG